MKKITSIISVLMIVCLLSGGYALISEDVSVDKNINSNSLDTQNTPTSNNNELKETNTITTTNAQKDTVNMDSSEYNIATNKKVLPSNYYELNDDIFTDRYIQCVCGGFISVGPITKPIPEEYVCDCGRHNGPNNPVWYFNTNSFEEVLYSGEHHTLEGFDGVLTRPMEMIEPEPHHGGGVSPGVVTIPIVWGNNNDIVINVSNVGEEPYVVKTNDDIGKESFADIGEPYVVIKTANIICGVNSIG